MLKQIKITLKKYSPEGAKTQDVHAEREFDNPIEAIRWADEECKKYQTKVVEKEVTDDEGKVTKVQEVVKTGNKAYYYDTVGVAKYDNVAKEDFKKVFG